MLASNLSEARRQVQDGQFASAIPALAAAAKRTPTDHELCRELVLAAVGGGAHEQAVAFCENALKHHPRSDWVWRQLGNELTCIDRLDDAEAALRNAKKINPKAPLLWRYLATLAQKRKNAEMESEALEALDDLGQANAADLNRLGTIYRKQHDFGTALQRYRRSAETARSPKPYLGMGLVFRHPEISQDLDAADSFRIALTIEADYEFAAQQLKVTAAKLKPLANKVRTVERNLLRANEHYQFY